MYLTLLILGMLFFLLGAFFLTAVISAFRYFQQKGSKRQTEILDNFLFFRPFYHFFASTFEAVYFSAICAQNISRFCYAACFTLLAIEENLFFNREAFPFVENVLFLIVEIILFLFISFNITDYLPRVLGTRFPDQSIRFCAPTASFFILLALPFSLFSLSSFPQLFPQLPLIQRTNPMLRLSKKLSI